MIVKDIEILDLSKIRRAKWRAIVKTSVEVYEVIGLLTTNEDFVIGYYSNLKLENEILRGDLFIINHFKEDWEKGKYRDILKMNEYSKFGWFTLWRNPFTSLWLKLKKKG